MEINTKTVEVLANTLKIDASVLTEQLTAQGEPKIAEHLKDKEVFTSEELSTLKKNVDHEAYEKGKIAGLEMDVKAKKEKFNLKGTEGVKTHDDLINTLLERTKNEYGGKPDEAVKQLKAEKEALQNNYMELESKLKEKDSMFEQFKTNLVVSSKVDQALNYVVIDEDDRLVSAQKEMLKDKFMNTYKIQVIDGKEYVIDSTGNKLVDKLQNPVSVTEVMKTFAPNYVRVKSDTPTGRGGKSSTATLPLSGELSGIKNKEQFEHFLKQKGINPVSSQALALYKEVFAKPTA